MIQRPGEEIRRDVWPRREYLVRLRIGHRLQPFYDSWLDENTCLISIDLHAKYGVECTSLYVRETTGPKSFFRIQSYAVFRLSAAQWIEFDESNEAFCKHSLMVWAQAPSRRRAVLHACTKTSVEQDTAGIKGYSTDLADALFERDV
jgi:hypothetical protein